MIYDPKQESAPIDFFGPLSEGNSMKLPEHVKVEIISTIEDIKKLDNLFTEKFIGVDSEWRPALTKFHKTYPALFQISGASIAYLVDFVALRES